MYMVMRYVTANTYKFYAINLKNKSNHVNIGYIPIGQRPFALLDSSKSINIKSISTAATIYLMSTALQNCKINRLYSVLPGKLEVINKLV